MKKRRERLRLGDPTPRHERKLKKKRERLVIIEPATARFIELMQEIGSNNHNRRHRAARRLAAHCAVVFREP